MLVPFMDLQPQTREVEHRLKVVWDRILQESSFVLSNEVTRFEEEFASFCGTKFCAGVANGTDALEIALLACGVKAGDEVIVPANSFVATAIAVTRMGAVPVFVDCEYGTWLIDTEKIEDAISSKTRAIIPVHLYGQLADMPRIREIADKFGLLIIEDAAQSQGAIHRDKGVGAFGDAVATSFYPGKNLGAFGDAGAVMTNFPKIHQNVLGLRNYGSPVKYQHPKFGFNSRLDSLQAAVLRLKLEHLNAWNAERAAHAQFYLAQLANNERIVLPQVKNNNKHVWHLFVVHVEGRDEVAERLLKVGIQTGIHYPCAIPHLGAFKKYGYQYGDFPVAENSAATCLSLPLFPGLEFYRREAVISQLKRKLCS